MSIPSIKSYKHEQRDSKIQSCAISLNDIGQLFNMLSQKASDAIKSEINFLRGIETLDDEKRAIEERNVKENMKLSFHLMEEKGGTTWNTDKSALNQENIPKGLRSLTFDNSIYYSIKTRTIPVNKFEVKIDFKKPPIFDLSVSPSEATYNESRITVSGNDQTWVVGVYQDVVDFFKERRKNRAWIHSRNTWDLLLLFLLIPLSFHILFKIQPSLGSVLPKLPGILYVGVNIWLFLVIITIFRLLLNYMRWAFPLIEFIRPEGSAIKTYRAIVTFFGLALISWILAHIFNFLFGFLP